jgi:hypothetical protein
MIRIVQSKILGGWFIVRGPHMTPIGGRFDSKSAALQHLRAAIARSI